MNANEFEYRSKTNKIELLEFLCCLNSNVLKKFNSFIQKNDLKNLPKKKINLEIFQFIYEKLIAEKIIDDDFILNLKEHFSSIDETKLIKTNLSSLNDLLKLFILTENFRNETSIEGNKKLVVNNWKNLISYAFKIGKKDLIKKLIDKAKTQLKKEKLYDAYYFENETMLTNYELIWINTFDFNYKKIKKLQREEAKVLRFVTKTLDDYIQNLTISNALNESEFTELHLIYNTAYELGNNKVQSLQKDIAIEISNLNYINFQINLIKLLKNKNFKQFVKAYALFSNLYKKFNSNQKVAFINILYNYLIIEEEQGNFYYEQMYALNKQFVNAGLLVNNNKVNVVKYKNILIVLYKLKKFDEANLLHNKYLKNIKMYTKDANFFIALKAFYESDFDKADDSFAEWNNNLNKGETNLNLSRQMFLLKLYYEQESKTFQQFLTVKHGHKEKWQKKLLNNVDYILSKIDSSKKNFQKNENESKDAKAFYKNFCLIILKLFKLRYKLNNIQHTKIKNSIVNIEGFKNEVEQKKVDIFWFTEKIKELEKFSYNNSI